MRGISPGVEPDQVRWALHVLEIVEHGHVIDVDPEGCLEFVLEQLEVRRRGEVIQRHQLDPFPALGPRLAVVPRQQIEQSGLLLALLVCVRQVPLEEQLLLLRREPGAGVPRIKWIGVRDHGVRLVEEAHELALVLVEVPAELLPHGAFGSALLTSRYGYVKACLVRGGMGHRIGTF